MSTPTEALATVRDAAVAALTLGPPGVTWVGFAGQGDAYDCGCDGGGSYDAAVRVEADSYEPTREGSDVGGGVGCIEGWRIQGHVIVRRCMDSFAKVAGVAVGTPTAAQREFKSTAILDESSTVALSLSATLGDDSFRFIACEPYGPEGNRGGYDIRFTYTTEF